MSLIISCPLLADMADDRGRITWEQACSVADSHSLLLDFLEDWMPKCCADYDAGVSAYDLAYWLGY